MTKLIRDEMYVNTYLPEDEGTGGGTDLTDYYKKPEVDNLLKDKADKTALNSKANTNDVYAKGEMDAKLKALDDRIKALETKVAGL